MREHALGKPPPQLCVCEIPPSFHMFGGRLTFSSPLISLFYMRLCRWAILKDEKVAKKMAKFLELNTIGVSHDSQVRATQIIKAVVQGYDSAASHESVEHQSSNRQSSLQHLDNNKLFHFGSSVMHYRWKRLRSALSASLELSILDFEPSYCTFFEKEVKHTPGMDSSPLYSTKYVSLLLRCIIFRYSTGLVITKMVVLPIALFHPIPCHLI